MSDTPPTGWEPAYPHPSNNPPALRALLFDQLPPSYQAVIRALRGIRPGVRVLIVGGAVRDALMGLAPKDLDLEPFGAGWDEVLAALRPVTARVMEVGRAFGHVWALLPDGRELDVNIPRRENKAGQGHRGYRVEFDPTITVRDAAARRDYTINSAALDTVTGEFFDFFGAEADCRARRLRATSRHFAEDAERVRRGFSLAARPPEGLTMTPETVALCRTLIGEALSGPVERVKREWLKWAARGRRPSAGLRVLQATGWLVTAPEIADLIGCPQDPEYHPEGDAWEHTLLTVDAAARIADRDGVDEFERTVLVFAALLHDVGKPATTRNEYRHQCPKRHGQVLTPEGQTCACGFVGRPGAGPRRIASPGHVKFAVQDGWLCSRCRAIGHTRGAGLVELGQACPKCGAERKRVPSRVEAFLRRIGVHAGADPNRFLWAVVELVAEHLAHVYHAESFAVRPRVAVQRLAERLRHTSIEMWARLVEADHSARPPLETGCPVTGWVATARQYGCASRPIAPVLTGGELLAMGVPGGKQGQRLGQMLRELRHAQVEGQVNTREEALEWLWRGWPRRERPPWLSRCRLTSTNGERYATHTALKRCAASGP